MPSAMRFRANGLTAGRSVETLGSDAGDESDYKGEDANPDPPCDLTVQKIMLILHRAEE
jgi:hypothetical protein